LEKLCSIKTNIDQANDMFAVINSHFYDGMLSIPIINVAVLNTKIMRSRYLPAVWNGVNCQRQAEIIIDASITSVDNTLEIFKELLHCAVLHYCCENGLKCGSRGEVYNYFNKRFEEIASSHGLICAKSRKHGRKVVGITSDAKNLVDKNGWCFLIERNKSTYIKPSHNIKYFCPVCGNSVRATKTVRISCLDCDKEMITGFDT
jgi:hypothetical protein